MLVVGRSHLLGAVLLSSLALLALAGQQQQQQQSPSPTLSPSGIGTAQPSPGASEATIEPSGSVTDQPSNSVVTDQPSSSVVTDQPSSSVVTDQPSNSVVTDEPTNSASDEPTSLPTEGPTSEPSTSEPTESPSASPTTAEPTVNVADEPTLSPTPQSTGRNTLPAGPTWGGCVDPQSGEGGIVKIGDRTTICLTIGPGGDWGQGADYLRWVFQPKADQYSRFHIPNSYVDLIKNDKLGNGILTVHAASQDSLSFLRIYLDPSQQRVFPFLTAIVDVKDGIVQGIAWDDACKFCKKDRCLENTYDFAGVASVDYDPPLKENTKGCYLDKTECDEIQKDLANGDKEKKNGGYEAVGANVCDLNLYVVWTGTDKDGNAFQSASSRFGAFPAAKLQNRISENLPDFPSIL